MKTEKLGGVAGGEGECGDDVAGWLVRERRSLDILPVKKEAKLFASEVPGEVVGSGEEDLRCRSILTVCQRRLGLSEAVAVAVCGEDATAVSGVSRQSESRKLVERACRYVGEYSSDNLITVISYRQL